MKPQPLWLALMVRLSSAPRRSRSASLVSLASLVGVPLLIAALGCEPSLSEHPHTDPRGPFEIASLVVARVYLDGPVPREIGQFQVWFDADPEQIDPTAIESVRISGPTGQDYRIRNTEFSTSSLSGYVRNVEEDYFWYQGVSLSPTLEPGEYTVDVKWKDGSRQFARRPYSGERTLLDAYLDRRAQMTYAPAGDTESAARETTLAWTTLAALSGPSAYYTAWMSAGKTDSADSLTARGGHIFREAAAGDLNAGLDDGRMLMSTEATPLPVGPYTWQVQITNTNALDEIHTIIFSPAQPFSAR